MVDVEELRSRIASQLDSDLRTQTEPVPSNSAEVTVIVDQLRALAPDDLTGRLDIAGFVDHPWGEDKLRCFDCMYYLPHRKWCFLPELSVPVEPDWWCRLWRI